MSTSNTGIKGSWEDWDTLIESSQKPDRVPLLDISKFRVVEKGGKARLLQSSNELRSVTRLLVVIPNEEVDEAALSRQIWILASNYRLNVLLLTAINNEEESMVAARRLATIAAMTRDTFFKIETHIIFSHSWKNTIRTFWRQTDMILCPSEQTVSSLWGKKKLLSQVLSDSLKAPVYTFSGLYHPSDAHIPDWLRKIPYWFVFLLIITVSFYFEVDVDRSWCTICLHLRQPGKQGEQRVQHYLPRNPLHLSIRVT